MGASQWGTHVRRIKRQAKASQDAHATAHSSISVGARPSNLSDFLDKKSAEGTHSVGRSLSVAGCNLRRVVSGDASVSSAHSAPVAWNNDNQKSNLTTGKMKMRTRSRSRSRNRKNVTTLPLLFSSSMSVSEDNEGNDNENWETASGSGYQLRGIDP